MQVQLGSEVLLASGRLRGRRVGVVCNPSSINHQFVHPADSVAAGEGSSSLGRAPCTGSTATTVTGDSQCRAFDKSYRVDTASARAFLGEFVDLL